MSEPTLFDPPLARTSDPIQSHLTVASIKSDSGLAADILRCLHELRACHEAVYPHRPWHGACDDDVVVWLENRHQRRFQRNVVARARGLLEQPDAGCVIERMPSLMSSVTGRPVIHYRLRDLP